MFRPLPEKDFPKLRCGTRLRQGLITYTITDIWGDHIIAVHVQNVRPEHLGGGKWEIWEDEPRPLAPLVVLPKKAK